MISVAILSVLVIATMTTIVAASRSTRLNSNALGAKNIAQGYFEEMAIDTFAEVDSSNYPDISAPSPPYDMDDASVVWLDRALQVPCSIDFQFKGFGTVQSGTSTYLNDSSAAWTTNEWVGDTLFLVDGTGAGQSALIESNTATRLNIDGTFAVSPSSNTRYMINNGKTVLITTTWAYCGRSYSQTVESLVANYRNSDDLGF